MNTVTTVPAVKTIVLPTIITRGLSGKEFISRGCFDIEDHAKEILPADYVVTAGKMYNPVMILSTDFEHFPTTDEVLSLIKEIGGISTPTECALYLPELISGDYLEALGIKRAMTMHPRIFDAWDGPSRLTLSIKDGKKIVDACYDDPSSDWSEVPTGFVFLLQQ